MDEEPEKPEWAVGHEDEYDALNDETFGDTGEEYTWENSQSMFGELQKPPTDSRANGASNGFSRSQVVETPEPVNNPVSKETEYYDYDNDNALLEESISRLVLDDLEDVEDEEEARKMKLSRLGASSNFNTYFMPPQVASKHLHWLMDKELPGGSSLLGSSVWSMHPTTAPEEPPTHIAAQPKPQPDVIGSAIQHPVRSNHVPNDDALSKDPFSNLFGGVHTSTPKSQPSKKPVFKTVEEIERELLEDGANTTPKATPNTFGDSPKPSNKPKVMMAEDLERELIQESPMPTPKHQEFDANARSPLMALGQLNVQSFSTETPSTPQNQSQQQKQVQQHFHGVNNNPPNVGTSPNVNFNNVLGGSPFLNTNAAVNNLLLLEQQKQLLLARQGLVPGAHPLMHPPGMLPGGPLPPQLAQGFHPGLSPLQQQQQLRMLQLNPHLRRMPIIMPIGPVMHPLRAQPIPQPGFPPPHHLAGGFRKQMKTDDPYRGLMTEKDKQRLRNIQIIQLQNDHPFTTDYYNLMHKVKHAPIGGEDFPKRNLLSKLYPKRDDESVHKNRYEPARFENSLGKLQAVSALAPKRVIDTVIRVTESRNAPRGGIKAYRYLLLEIEKLYECLLTMEEADIRVAILCNAADDDLQRRSQNSDKLTRILKNGDKLKSILSVAKGKMLICRVLPLTDAALRYKVLGHLLDIFPVWANKEMDKAFPYLRHCILHAEIRDLLNVVSLVTDNNVFESVVVTKLGISVLTCIFHQAEKLLSKSEPMIMEDLESLWTRKSAFGILAILVKQNDLSEPIEVYPNLMQHIRRFALHTTDFQMLESILQRWFNAGVSIRQ